MRLLWFISEILFGLGGVLFFLAPLLFAEMPVAQLSDQIQESIFCGTGESYSLETFREEYHEPGELGMRAICQAENGQRREVTGWMVLVLAGMIVLPMALGFVGLMTIARRRPARSTPYETSYMRISGDVDQLTPEVQEKLRRVGLGGVVDLVEQQRRGASDDAPSVYGMSMGDFNRKLQERPAAGGKSLAQKLQDLAEARDRRHISDEEYETLRKRILDEFGLR